jgi:hypothetical protein
MLASPAAATRWHGIGPMKCRASYECTSPADGPSVRGIGLLVIWELEERVCR